MWRMRFSVKNFLNLYTWSNLLIFKILIGKILFVVSSEIYMDFDKLHVLCLTALVIFYYLWGFSAAKLLFFIFCFLSPTRDGFLHN